MRGTQWDIYVFGYLISIKSEWSTKDLPETSSPCRAMGTWLRSLVDDDLQATICKRRLLNDELHKIGILLYTFNFLYAWRRKLHYRVYGSYKKSPYLITIFIQSQPLRSIHKGARTYTHAHQSTHFLQHHSHNFKRRS